MKLRLKEICERKGITRIQIEDATGLKKGYLSDLFNGKSNPTVETLQKIADALKVEVWELFTSSISKEELTALIAHKGEFYRASTVEELEGIVEKIKQNI